MKLFRRRLRLKRLVLTILAVFVCNLIVDWLNPFQIDDAVKARASVIIQQIAAFSYNGEGRDHVTVVLIDDNFFKTLKSPLPKVRTTPIHWPLPVLTIKAVVRSILYAEPAALFVDFAFADTPREIVDGGRNTRAEALSVLAKSFVDLSARNPRTPIFLSNPILHDTALARETVACPSFFMPEESMQRANVTARGFVDEIKRATLERTGQGEAPLLLQFVDTATVQPDGGYLLAPARIAESGDCASPGHEGRDIILSPALALFRAFEDYNAGSSNVMPEADDEDRKRLYQAVRPQGPPIEGFQRYDWSGVGTDTPREGIFGSTQDLSPLAIRWGGTLSDNMKSHFSEADGASFCYRQFEPSSLENTVFTSFLVWAEELYAGFKQALAKPLVRVCPYIDVISASRLVEVYEEEDAEKKLAVKDGKIIKLDIAKDFLKGRVVLLGASIPQAQDRFDSPVSGDIPGVFLHAAALENLISAGAGYHRIDMKLRLPMLIIVAIFIGVAKLGWDYLVGDKEDPVGWRREFVWGPLVFSVVVTLTSFALAAALWSYTPLPATEIAIPVIALYTILFGGWIGRLEDRIAEGTLGQPGGVRRTAAHARRRAGARLTAVAYRVRIMTWRRSAGPSQPDDTAE